MRADPAATWSASLVSYYASVGRRHNGTEFNDGVLVDTGTALLRS